MPQRRFESGAPDHRIDCRLRTIGPDHSIRRKAHKGTHCVQYVPFTRLDHRRHHHDITQPSDRLINDSPFHLGSPAFRGSLEQHTAVYIVRQEKGIAWRHPGRVRHFGHFCQNLCPRVAASDNQYMLPREGLRLNIVGGMQLLATEQFSTGVRRNVGVAPGSRGTDNGFGIPMPLLRMHTQCAGDALDRGNPHGPFDGELITRFILGQVINDMLARGIAILYRRHHPAGNGTPSGRREQSQGLPAMTPGPSAPLLGIKNNERELGAT
ncbi:hypothetical protein D3C77_244640 [compost metagenome]